ncbi:MAG: type II toxin-antitoxin system prevent-host-death family antitoxin [Deltaproteobacteria bacterium]
MSREIAASKAREQLGELLNLAAFGKVRVVLTRRGRKLAALIPIADLELFERLEEAYQDQLAAQHAEHAAEGAKSRLDRQSAR